MPRIEGASATDASRQFQVGIVRGKNKPLVVNMTTVLIPMENLNLNLNQGETTNLWRPAVGSTTIYIQKNFKKKANKTKLGSAVT